MRAFRWSARSLGEAEGGVVEGEMLAEGLDDELVVVLGG